MKLYKHKDIYLLIFSILLISSIGFLIYNFYYTVYEYSGKWFRDYAKDWRVLIFTLSINIIAVISWFIARKKGCVGKICDCIDGVFKDIKQSHKQYFQENKLSYILTSLVQIVIIGFFSYLFISLCFFNNSGDLGGRIIDTKGQLIMALVFFIIVYILYKFASKIGLLLTLVKTSFSTRLLFAFVFLFILQLYLVTSISTRIGWDVEAVVGAAKSQDTPIQSGYLGTYPNNLLLFFIIHHLVDFFKLIGLTDTWLGLSVVNVLLVDLALFVSIIIIKKVYPSSERCLLFFIISSLLVGLSPWVIVPYSDTFSMPVVALLILSCICTVQAKTNIKRILCAAVSGFLLAIGWLIKATIIAIPAALTVIVFIYAVQKRKELKKQKIIELRRFATIIITGVLVCVSALITFNFYVDNQSIVEFDKTIKTPASYTIATGMVEKPAACTRPLYGAWNYDTANLNNGTTQEKDEKFKTFIKEKLDELGFNGYMKFLIKKARWMTSEGHFCWLREGGGTADFSNPDANFLKSLFYNNGKHYMFFIHAANGLWIVVFLGLCLGMLFSWLRGFKQTDKFNADLFLCLSVFFIIVVLLFTEGRSRYLISFLPIFCIISANGYSRIIDSLRLISQEV